MKQTGMIRKIDALGRIVIPKEIRSSLNIKESDDLEIYIENENIILKKYSYLDCQEKEYIGLSNIMNKLTDGEIFISDKEKIISEGIIKSKNIPLEFINMMNLRKESTINGNFNFEDISLEGNFLLNPIIKNSNIEGLIIIYKKDNITSDDKMLSKVIKTIYENK